MNKPTQWICEETSSLKAREAGTQMELWYPQYWAQTWYRNTFLVNYPQEIGQAIEGGREWNNLHDSGCHFTCMAMIAGIDPAHLASELSAQQYFHADSSLPAKNFDGRYNGLTWDRNYPNQSGTQIVIDNIWHPLLNKRTTITIQLMEIQQANTIEVANRIVADAREKGWHIICGTTEHSCLVAGIRNGKYFIWDPDTEEGMVENILAGEVLMEEIFSSYPARMIELWCYLLGTTN